MKTNRDWFLKYGSAILFCGLALLVIILIPLREGFPFLVFIGAVTLTARYAGFLPALLATVLGSLAGVYFFLGPAFSIAISTPDALRILAFIIVSLLISSLTASRERAQLAVSARARQQAAVAALGQEALADQDLSQLLNEASRLVCQTLEIEYCKVLELLPDRRALLLRAGYGWKEGLVGHAIVDAGSDSQAGYTLMSKEPVIVRDLRKEKRFPGTPLLAEHGVISGMSVIIYGPQGPFGILGAHTSRSRRFSQDDVNFLQAIANVLAGALARDDAETQVREQRNWLGVTLESIGNGLMATDSAGRITLMNSAAESMTGWKLEAAKGRAIEEVLALVAEKTGESLRSRIAAITQEGKEFAPSDQTLLDTKDGRQVPVDLKVAPIRDEQGNAFGAVFTFRDITESRKVQDQLEYQALILQNVRDSIIVTDPKGSVVYWNHGAQAIFGYSSEEMLGKGLGTIYPDFSDESFQADLNKIAAGVDYVGEWQGRRKDGTWVWVDIKTTPLYNNADEQIGFIGVSSDITERRRAEERLTAQYSVTRVLAESTSLDEATPKILRAVCESLDWDVGVVWNLDPEVDLLRCLDIWHLPTFIVPDFERLTRELLFPRNVGLPGWVWSSGAPQWVPDIVQEPSFPRAKVASKNDLRGTFAFPITSDGRFVGVLEFFSRHVRPPDSNLLDMMNSLGSQIGQFVERKRAEEALRLSREQQAIILRGVADGVTAQGVDGELIYANDAAAQLIGFPSPQELLATPLTQIMSRFQVFDEEDRPLSATQLPGRAAVLEKRATEKLLHFRTLPDGAERWSFVRASPVLDDQGKVQFAINIFHDVTESRRVDRQVREQSELLRVTLTSIGDGVIASDPRGKITFMNSVAEMLTGWNASEAMGQPLDTVFHILNEETGAVIESPVSRVLRERQVVQPGMRTLLVAKDGRRINIDDSGAPIRDAAGNLIGVVVTFRDITEKRRTEGDISQLASIVQTTEDAILTTTAEGIVQTWNPGAQALYGYAADEIIGKSIMITYPPEHHDEFREIVGHLRRGESMAHFETTRIRKDGRRVDVSITPSAIRDAAGRLIGVSKIARDITDRKRAERAQRFLTDAGDLLASSLDYETTLKSVAQLAVPQMADWCSVHVKAEDGSIRQLALAHVNPNQLRQVHEMQERYPLDPNSDMGAIKVIRTGKPELVRYLTDGQIAASARDPQHLQLLLDLNPRSYMIVPLIARGRILGAITFLSAESGRRYDEADLLFAQELARRAAFAVDNARLYQEAQALNEQLERRVIDRTVELQRANRRLESEIAERQRANEQLRLLSGYLQSAREDERVRIAREIHDEIGQVLTAVKMDLSLLERELEKTRTGLTADQVHEQFGSTKKLVDQALDTMHGIVRELRPEILDHLGLTAAIEWQLQEFQTRTNIACIFDASHEEIELDEQRSIAVFRILQETLTNVARHSGATEVQVSLKQEDHHVLLKVCDNGKGVDERALQESKTFGILGMRERAHIFGGEVAVSGMPGQGTIVSVRIPL